MNKGINLNVNDNITTLSIRNIAEYVYCPRLFYFLEIEGIEHSGEDVELGRMLHRSVDKPNLYPDIENILAGKEVKSLALANDKLGISGKCDLVRFENNDQVVPIEYKKGKSKFIPVSLKTIRTDEKDDYENDDHECEAWESDKIQIALQAILLETNGLNVLYGEIIYLTDKRKITVEITELLKDQARSFIEKARLLLTSQKRPKPLQRDPKCNLCSLLEHCMPEEVNYLNHENLIKNAPRNLWPPQLEGIQIVALTQGVKIGLDVASLHVTNKFGEKIKKIPFANLDSILLIGNVQVSSQAIAALAEEKVPIAWASSVGRLLAFIDPMCSTSALVKKKQVYATDNDKLKLDLSRKILSTKVKNQRRIILRNSSEKEIPEIIQLKDQIQKIEIANSIEELLGHEGYAAKLYFSCFSNLLNGQFKDVFQQNGRQKRPAPDPVNSLLSFAYSMLTHECICALRLARLEPSIGALHVSKLGRPALALDLMEIFRPLIADSLVLKIINKGEIKFGHFQHTAEGCFLTSHGRKIFFEAWNKRMEEQITHPVFSYRLSYRRMIIFHAKMIAAWFCGDLKDLNFLTTR